MVWYVVYPSFDPLRDLKPINIGIPMIFSSSKTLATEVVKSDDKEIEFKLRQEYTPKLMPMGKAVNSLVSLALSPEAEREKVVYHKDMWNEKDYSHEGLGKAFKTLNGDPLRRLRGRLISCKDRPSNRKDTSRKLKS
jgi:hypothetical protein